LRFTENHPDVIETVKIVDALKATRQREVEAYLSQQASAPNALADVNEMNLDIHAEISRIEGVIASLSVRILDYQAKINDLKSKIDLVPQVEAEQTALNRDYDILRQKYTELLSRREAAGLSQRADISSDDLQFRVIEPPQIPISPSGPNRLIFYTLVIILGFGSGAGIAFLLSQFSPILFRASQLASISEYPILGAVSHLNRDSIARAARVRLTVFMFSSLTLLSMYGVLVTADILQIDIVSRILS
jgi:polysaccharide chain length determinant protein (PEP-CTERM system associated)